MRNRYLSLFLAILFGMFIISPSFCQTVGIGLSSLYITLSTSVGDSVSSTIGVINPSPYAAKAKIYFDCTSCKSDLYFFGTKIGEIIEDPYQLISIDKKEVYVPPNTMGDGIP
ncbi:MAG: hypothetical protein J7L39_01965, partial [Candidatus Aenigmarchaeota archaeon]|nr:hypothetical protein [Candidatus Aenigmarchaeota archaeon]